ncbi:cell wall-binding repeat 2 family protein [Pontibacter actiniarum]|uniref:cell wall-binding repeat 2 family protein n=1 Tax=Pontibacter actiniarum TaxID=323450 RepID=UPI000424A153|nr:cell wall-binding repeat 2 family protein [Pontibacter actiniarum]
MIRLRYIFALAILAVLSSCGKTEGPPGAGSLPLQNEANFTAYTVRLPGRTPEEQAILLTQTVYPATREDNAVGAIILVPQDEIIAFTAMQRITHMPVNAPLMYLTKDNHVSEATLREMKRLKPDGVLNDRRVDVYAVNVPEAEVNKVREILGYKVRTFYAKNPVQLAEILDRWQGALKSDHPDEVIMSALDHPDGMKHGIGAMGWNAHMGRGFAWVYRDSIPEATKRILERRSGDHGSYIYLTGGPDVISNKVAKELGRYGLVRRIFGENVYASNTVNAGYKDYGRNYGWWWNWEQRALGWGIAQAGHNFIIGNADNMLGMIPAAVLGHMGKHGPILLVAQDSVPQAVNKYLTMVKPFPTGPQETILNYAWIIGDTSTVSEATQREVDFLLSPFKNPKADKPLSEADTLQQK